MLDAHDINENMDSILKLKISFAFAELPNNYLLLSSWNACI